MAEYSATNRVLTSIEEATPEWLTALFRQKEILHKGRVSDVQIEGTISTNVSQAYFLQLTYADATGHAPARLFVKIPNPDPRRPADKEVEFYTRVAPEMLRHSNNRQQLFPTCYDVGYAPATNQSHLLLEDLSATHFTHQGLMPPDIQLCESVIDAYGYLHAWWWEHAWLDQRFGGFLTEEVYHQFLAIAQAKQAEFAQAVGDAANADHRLALEAIASAWPAHRRQRVMAGVGVTLVHRDPHPRNFLYPFDRETHGVKLIDWQSWRVDTGTDDLAYLMACHWPPVEVAELKQELLKRYHAQLIEHGVGQYSWHDCWYDYRASVIRCLFFLLVAWSPAQWAGGVWWQRVQRGLATFERLQCADLLAD